MRSHYLASASRLWQTIVLACALLASSGPAGRAEPPQFGPNFGPSPGNSPPVTPLPAAPGAVLRDDVPVDMHEGFHEGVAGESPTRLLDNLSLFAGLDGAKGPDDLGIN